MPPVCRFYKSATGCRYGSGCRNLHVDEPNDYRTQAPPRAERAAKPCRFYGTARGCRYGNRCRYAHGRPADGYSTASSSSRVSSVLESSVEPAASAAAAEPVAEATSRPSADDSKAVVLYDQDVALQNIIEAQLNKKFGLTKRVRRPGAELEMAKCGVCKKDFSSSETPEASCLALRNHYVEKLGNSHQKHVKIFRRFPELEQLGLYCWACDEPFLRVQGLFSHIKAMAANKRDADFALEHRELFETIVKGFVDRDTGYEVTEEDLLASLRLCMCESEEDDYDFMYDDDDDEVDVEDDDDDDDYNNGHPGGIAPRLARMLAQMHASGAVLDSDEEDGGMLGFSRDDVDELLCQGIKPWDSDADDALDAIYGGYDFY